MSLSTIAVFLTGWCLLVGTRYVRAINVCSIGNCNPSNPGSCTFNFWANQQYFKNWPTTVNSDGLLEMVPDQCQQGFEAFDGRCWGYSYGYLGAPTSEGGYNRPVKLDWESAELVCNDFAQDSPTEGCHLASVNTDRENCFMYERIETHTYFRTNTHTGLDSRGFNDRHGCHSNKIGNGDEGRCWLGLDQKSGTEGILYGWNTPGHKYDRRPRRNGGFSPWAGFTTSQTKACFDEATGDMKTTGCCAVDKHRSSGCTNVYYEPNNVEGGTEDCAVMWDRPDSQGEWNDVSCVLYQYPYVCNKPAKCRPGFYRSKPYSGMPVRSNTALVDNGINSTQYSMGVCTQCPAGSFHKQESDWDGPCSPCAPGRYGLPGSTNASCTAPCPVGSYCTGGTSSTTIIACPGGTYNPTTGASSIAACLTTPAGYWSSVNSSEYHTCSAGRCGNEGQSSPACSLPCPAGHSCNSGTTCLNAPQTVEIPLPILYPKPCNSIHLFAPAGQGSCSTVSGGHYTIGNAEVNRTGEELCPPGAYCQNGELFLCNAGTYSNAFGSSDANSCLPCQEGYFCPPGSTSSSQEECFVASPDPNPINKPKMYYCPGGTTKREDVSENHYTIPVDEAFATTRTGQVPCTSAQVCIDGEAFDKIKFTSESCSVLTLEENNVDTTTGRSITGELHSSLLSKNYSVEYILEDFALASDLVASLGGSPCDPKANSAPFSNAEIFELDPETGVLSSTRSGFPDYLNYEPTDASGEKCLTAGVRYDLQVLATASGESTVTTITCTVRVVVTDQNDAPYWPLEEGSLVRYRSVPEKSTVNTAVGRCDFAAHTVYGCPVLHGEEFAIGMKAADEDYFSVLRYEFVLGEGSAATWEEKDNPFRINSCDGMISMKGNQEISFLTTTLFNLTVKVTDDGNGGQFGKLSAYTTVIIYITDAPDPPVLDSPGLYDFVVEENREPHQLIGRVEATDPDFGAVIKYRLEEPIDGDAFYMDEDFNIRTNEKGSEVIDFETTKTLYTINVVAFDCTPVCPGLSDTKSYTIRVLDTNDPPRFQEVTPFYIKENSNDSSPVCFDSSGVCPSLGERDRVNTYDVDGGSGDETLYSIVNGSTHIFEIDSNGQIRTKAGAKSLLNFEDEALTVMSGTGRSFSVTVRANSTGTSSDWAYNDQIYIIYLVDENEPPVLNASVPDFFVLETAPVGSACEPEDPAVLLLSATDPDNADQFLKGLPAPRQSISFTRVAGVTHPTNHDGGNLFAILPVTEGAAIKMGGTLNFETAPGGPDCGTGKCYIIRVKAVDNGVPSLSVETWVKIRIVDVNEGPVFPAPLTRSFEISENVTDALVQVSGTYSATDADNDVLSFFPTGGTGFDLFTVQTSCGGTCFFVNKIAGVTFDFESGQTSYSLNVQVTDDKPSKMIGQGCSIVNDVPSGCDAGSRCVVRTNPYQSEFRCTEYCPPTTDGRLQIPRRDVYFCDYDAITDGSTTPSEPLFKQTAEASLRINIEITDWNDPPYIIGDDGASGDELACVLTTSVTYTKQNTDQIALTNIRATDVDVEYAAAPFTFEEDNPTDPFWATFTLDHDTGSIGIFPTVEDGNNTNKFLVLGEQFTARVRVLDESPHDPDAPQMSSTCQIVVDVVNLNVRPNFTDPLPFIFMEGSEPQLVGVLAPDFALVDPDVDGAPPDKLVFSMSVSPYFVLDSETSELFLEGQPLDYEELSESNFRHVLVVRVRDLTGADDVATVTINVQDVNEAPEWTQLAYTRTIFENTTELSSIIDLKPLAPDPDTFADGITAFKNTSFSIVSGCTESCPFELVQPSTTGILQVKAGNEFDFEGPNRTWTITLRATDGGDVSMTADATLTINLADVNERPKIATDIFLSVPEGAAGQFLADLGSLITDTDAADPLDKLKINITNGDPLGVFVIEQGQLFVSPTGFLDYENIRDYVLNITVTDTGNLQSSGMFYVNVTNVNDVTVTGVTILTADGLLNCNEISRVRIVGTNFGLVALSPPAQVTVRFRRPVDTTADPSPPVRFAQDCEVVSNNTVIECNIPPTAGDRFVFDVFISVPSTVISGDNYQGFAILVGSAKPTITGVSGASALSTAGGNSIVDLTGTCFGTTDDAVSFGGSLAGSFSVLEFCDFTRCIPLSSGCTVLSPTQIRCVNAIPAGLGNTLKWKVKILGQSQTAYFTQGSYAAPTLSTINNSTLPTNGQMSEPYLILTGTNFGPLDSIPQLAYITYLNYSYHLRTCTVSVAFTTVTCRSLDPGVGFNMRAFISFGNQLSAQSPFTVNFTAPTIVNLSGQGAVNASTIGGQFVTLNGTNFGPVCGTPGASIDAGGVNCGNVTATYKRGSISTVTGLPIVYTAFPCAVMSQTQIVCSTAPGTGKDHVWTVFVGGQRATMAPTAGTTSYGSPVVATYDGVGAFKAETNGGQSINIQGSNFGPIGGALVTAKYGNKDINLLEFSASNCSVTRSQTQITCTTAPGAGNELNWVVIVDDQLGQNELTNYAPPALISTSFDTVSSYLDNDGGSTFTITGTNFGPAGAPGPYLESATYGPPNFAFAAPATCVILSHTAMNCTVGSGSGTGLVMVVTIKGQSSPVSPFVFSYRPPDVSGGLLPLAAEKRTEGGAIMFIKGNGFSLCDPQSSVRIQWKEDGAVAGATEKLLDISGVWNAEGTIHNPSCPIGPLAQVSFVVPEMNVARKVFVRVQVTSSTFGLPTISASSVTYTYDNPVLASIFAEASAVNFGGVRVSIFGNNFCKAESCCRTHLDSSPLSLESIVSHSHNKIVVEVSRPGSLFVRCGSISSNALSFTTNSPFVFGTTPQLNQEEFRTAGNQTIEIWGLHFGETAPNVTINGTEVVIDSHGPVDCYSVSRPSTADSFAFESGAQCYRTVIRTPAKTGRNLALEVSRGSTKSLADDVRFEFLNYKLATITQATGSAFDAPMSSVGGGLVTLDGTNFGLFPGQVLLGEVNNNPVVCDIQSWNDTQVVCIVGEGEGANLIVTVFQEAGTYTVVPDRKVSFLPPSQIDYDNSTEFDTLGGTVLELFGLDFGRENRTVIHVGTELCTLLYSNHTYARCRFPEGEGTSLTVTLSAGGQEDTAYKLASYGAPEIHSITPDSNIPTSGGMLLTITGKNFGVNHLRLYFDAFLVAERFLDPDPQLNKDVFDYPGTNHTHIQLTMPEFFGAHRHVTVWVRNRVSLNAVNISFAAPQIGDVSVYNEDGSVSPPFSTSEDLVFPAAAFNASLSEGLPSDGSGRRRLNSYRRRRLADAGYGLWTSKAFSPCESNIRAKGLYWRQFSEIAPNGQFRRTFNHFREADCRDSSDQTFVVTVQGVLTDQGTISPDAPTSACGLSRVYQEMTQSVTVTILASNMLDSFFASCSCVSTWTVGSPVNVPHSCLTSNANCPLLSVVYGEEFPPGVAVYGAYIISNDQDIYLSKTVGSIDQLNTKTSLKFPDIPTASIQPAVASLVSSIPKGPTDGCFVWEPIRQYLERADRVSKETGIPVSQIPRTCEQRALLEISGSNFGKPLTAEQALAAGPNEPSSLRVFLVPDDSSIAPFEASTVSSPGSHMVVCPSPDCFQTHDKIRFWIPYGVGKSLKIMVHVGDQHQNATTRFSYLPPRIQEMNPGTVRMGRKFQNALGEPTIVRGHNFGGRATTTAVLISGRPCANPKWDSGSSADTDGRPFITCDTPVDVVGPKSVMLCVAGQLSVERLFRSDGPVLLAGEAIGAWDTSKPFTQSFASQLRSTSLTRCPPGSTGRLYELCLGCPKGATCEDGSFSGPKSDKFFFDYQIPVRNPDGSITDRAKALCSAESYNESFLNEYPDLVQRDSCNAFVGCEPKSACIGNSACNTGYEYAQPLCMAKRGYLNQTAFFSLSRSEVENTTNACNVVLNPYTFEFEGVNADCRGGLGEQETCTFDHPEHCARCAVFKDGDDSYYGACECALPARCSLCTIGTHYRMNNECVPCPENPGLLIGGLFALAIAVAVIGWYLQREQVNLAFITIGIDYFQVLAIFAATKVPWPPALLALFNIMSVFNFNIDITAPECLAPNLDYEVKWWLQMALPLALFTILALIYVGYAGIKMVRWGIWQAHVYQSHLSALIAIFMIAMYYLYLVLTKKALEVFNCNPVDPDDGFLYTSFTSLKCDGGGLCRCGEPGGPQERLVPFAIVFLVLYTFGYPAYIAMTLKRHSLLVREDQYLRAYEVGYVRKTNPDCYDMRKRYSKLYYQFKPRYASFWILVLLIRKFWIAFAFILFRGNPSFQLAVILLVLFTSIVFQVLWRPYLSTGDRPEIVRELDSMAERSIKEQAFAQYREIQKRVQECMTLDVEHRRRLKQTKQGAQLFSGVVQDSGKNLGLTLAKKEKVSVSVAAARWFTNLNTLEFILLGCGIIVCLAGIMFEASARDNRALVRSQVEGITWIVLVTIVGSFIYYFLFFLGEAAPRCISSLLRLCRRKKDDDDNEYYDPNINLEENPMFAAPKVEFADNRMLQAELDQQLAQLKLAEQQNRRLRDELKNKKMEAQLDETAKQKPTGLEDVRPSKQRKDFAQTRLTAALVGPNRQRARGNKKLSPEDDDEEEEDVEAAVRPKTGMFSRMSISLGRGGGAAAKSKSPPPALTAGTMSPQVRDVNDEEQE